MFKQPIAVSAYLLLAIILASCASAPQMMVPDTQPGDQILKEYVVGKWCTNRGETATENQAAGHSGMVNISPVFWRFASDGDWDTSISGWLYEPHGSWRIDGLDKLELSTKSMDPKSYQVRFQNNGEGADLYLIDAKNQFTVLSRCK